MSVDEYAEHKGLTLSNPRIQRKRGKLFMAKANGTASKSDLQDQIDEAIDLLDDAYGVDLAEAVGSALDVLRGNGDDDSDDSDNGDDDSDDDLTEPALPESVA